MVLFLVPLVLEGRLFLGSQYFWGVVNGLDSYAWVCFRAFEKTCLSRGTVPFWNPYTLNGVPWQGWVSNVYSPSSLLWWFTGDPLTFSKLSLYWAFVWSSLGMFGWCRWRRLGHIPSVSAGLVFSQGGLFWGQLYLGHLEILMGLAWASWVGWSFDVLSQNRSWRAILGAALASTAQYSMASMPAFYCTITGVFLWGLLQSSWQPRLGWRGRLSIAQWLGSFLVALALCGLLTFHLWSLVLPSRAWCNRPLNQPEYYTSYAGRPQNALGLLLPHIFDNTGLSPRSPKACWASWAPWEGYDYLGACGLVLMCLGLLGQGRRRALAFSAFLALSLLVAWDPSSWLIRLYASLGLDPVVGQLRCPSRYLLWFHLYGAVLIGHGCEAITSGPDLAATLSRGRRLWLGLLGFSAGAVALIQLISPASSAWREACQWLYQWPLLGSNSPNRLDFQVLQAMHVNLYAQLLQLFGVSFLGLMLFQVLATKRNLTWLIPCLMLCDLYLFVQPWLVLAPSTTFGLPKDLIGSIQRTQQGYRYETPAEQTNQGMVFERREISGFLPIAALAYQQFWISCAVNRPLPDSQPPFVVNFVAPIPEAVANFFCREWSWNGALRTSKNCHVPLLLHTQVRRSTDEWIRVHLAANMEPSQLWIDRDVPGLPGDSGAAVELLKWTEETNQLSIDFTASRHGYLTIKDGYWPGWKASVDEEPVEVWSSFSGLCRTVAVPAGTHRLKMWYEPPRLSWLGVRWPGSGGWPERLCLILSLLVTLLWVGLLLIEIQQTRRKRSSVQ